MTVFKNCDRWDASNARFDTDGRLRYSKQAGEQGGMDYVDYGLSVLSRQLVLDRIDRDTVTDLADLFAELGECGELAGLEVHERFYEVGSAAGIEDLERLLARRSGGH